MTMKCLEQGPAFCKSRPLSVPNRGSPSLLLVPCFRFPPLRCDFWIFPLLNCSTPLVLISLSEPQLPHQLNGTNPCHPSRPGVRRWCLNTIPGGRGTHLNSQVSTASPRACPRQQVGAACMTARQIPSHPHSLPPTLGGWRDCCFPFIPPPPQLWQPTL